MRRTGPSTGPPPSRGGPVERADRGSWAPTTGAAPPGAVLLVIDSLDGGGAERYVVDLAIALRGRGWPVEVACSTGGVRAGALTDAGIPVSVLLGGLVKRRVSGGYGRALRRLVRDRRPAVVHAHLYASAAAAVVATRGLSVPVVLTEHTEAPWRDRAARAISRRVYQRVDHVVAVSSAIRDTLVGTYGVPSGRVDLLLPATAAPAAAPRRATGGTAATVGVVGRLVPEKGVDVFLRAVALVSAAVPAARFVVVGDGPLRAALEDRAVSLGLTGVVTFTGFRPDAPQLIAGLDVLVVPSRSDGSPLVVCEAMAAGIPVVASRVGGLPDLVAHGDSGLLVRPEDPADLARSLVRLLRDPAAAQALGRRGRQLAEARSHARLVDRMTEVYAAVARSAVPALA
ncbi:MAG: glycosyl transferase group 1 [Modestobacter sp.]|nr:glycosyl transferase group 1 [Modestobacter sp.]